MATMFDVSQQALVERTKEELKNYKEIQPPEWAKFAKTGAHKERVPAQEDWWYFRTASVLRVIALRGPVGVSKLRTRYGGSKNRGVRPHRFGVASGNILRKILQQLETAGLAKQTVIGVHKGRIVTPAGQKLLDMMATDLIKTAPKAEIPKPVKAKAVPKADKKEEKPAEEKPASKAEKKARR